MGSRKQYSKAFKLDAISLVVDQKYSCQETASNLGIGSSMLGRWIREDRENTGEAFRGNGKLTAEQEELRRLKLQVKRLEMEREILKKATVFFAKETK